MATTSEFYRNEHGRHLASLTPAPLQRQAQRLHDSDNQGLP